MDVKIKFNFIFVFILVNIECLSAEDPSKGHFRCTWHHGKSASGNGVLQITNAKQTSCSVDDSVRLSSYINHCTKQNYVPLLACQDTGEWNCESFIAMCKTMVRNDPVTSDTTSRTTMVPRKIMSSSQTEQKPRTNDPAESSMKEFNPNENYFTMKEMAVAVLVSFITGATVLALVIFVVWRWRNCHVDSENRREDKIGSMKHIVSLEVLGHLAHALGLGHDKPSHNSFVNPNYGQLVTTRDILEEVINEQDRAYEEICTRRKSSCNHADCIYATVDKSRKHPTVIRTKSGSELRTIDESCESDVGYDADNNATPQTPKRVLKYLTNAMYSVPRSPHFNDARVTFGEVDAEMLRHSLNRLRQFHPITDVEKPRDDPRDDKEPEKVLFSCDTLPTITNAVDCNKSDSGYVDELTEITIEEMKTEKNVENSERANDSEHNDTPLRL